MSALPATLNTPMQPCNTVRLAALCVVCAGPDTTPGIEPVSCRLGAAAQSCAERHAGVGGGMHHDAPPQQAARVQAVEARPASAAVSSLFARHVTLLLSSMHAFPPPLLLELACLILDDGDADMHALDVFGATRENVYGGHASASACGPHSPVLVENVTLASKSGLWRAVLCAWLRACICPGRAQEHACR
jgi:hypothetical protein